MAQPRIEYEQLIAYAAGTLKGAEAQAVERHIANHPIDAATVARYRLVQTRVAGDDSAEPSPSALARAKAIFNRGAVPSDRESWLTRAERFVARLIYDSRVQPAAVRHAGTSDRFELTYAGQRVEIDLQAHRTTDVGGADRWQLIGQFAGDASTRPRRAALVAGQKAATVVEALVDDRGVFTLEFLPGRYELLLETPTGIVVVPDLEF